MRGREGRARYRSGWHSRSLRHSVPSSSGVLPVVTTIFGPRTATGGLEGITWPVMSQSDSISHLYSPDR